MFYDGMLGSCVLFNCHSQSVPILGYAILVISVLFAMFWLQIFATHSTLLKLFHLLDMNYQF